jgi:early secretory antigenic target protein ESAT-6
MSSFNISFTGGEQFSQELMQQTQQIQNALDELDGKIQPILAEWEGSTVQSYDEHKARWNNAVQQMYIALNTGSKTMAQIVDTHSTNERNLTKNWA